MSVELKDAKVTASCLEYLIERHDEIHIASAWGYNGRLAECLIRNKHKFSSVTFGLAFCQTDPDLIDHLVDVRNAFVADSGHITFHPKIYYFQSGNDAEAIIGSSNFTQGGMSKNWEANVHVKGSCDEKIFRQVRVILKSYEGLRKPVSKDLAQMYRVQFEAAKRLRRPQNPVLPGSGLPAVQINSNLVRMSWDDYVQNVVTSRNHNPQARLRLLRKCQAIFVSASSFADLSVYEWKAIAGVIGVRQAAEAGLDSYDWAWFGSMKGMGDFANRVGERDASLARAVDCIPRHGDVTKGQYDDFCVNFLAAFEAASRVGGVPTATRLLAMKRPDTFVCVSKPNLARLTDALALPKTTLELANYWDRVVEPIRASTWFNSPRPNGEYGELWDGRVAMLDAIYYAP